MTCELVLIFGLMNIKVRENAGRSVYCIRVQCLKCFVLYLGIDGFLWTCEACRSSRYPGHPGLVHPLLIVVMARKYSWGPFFDSQRSALSASTIANQQLADCTQ